VAYPPGTDFAGFTLDRVLGTGGMGTVYLARHPRLPRWDALKLLSPELSHDPDFRRRFEQEADLAAGLDHRNIVAVHDRGCDRDQLWIDMQYVQGIDCSEALEQYGPMPAEQALRIVTEVGKGLDYAHRMGLLHRDVKPANILLAESSDPEEPGRVLLSDFGVAKAVDAGHRLTSTGNFVATLAYAAPEQIQAWPLDHRVDVYALGCVLYELLTGTVPFPGNSQFETMHAHLNTAPPRPSEWVPSLPRAIDDVVATAMAKDRDQRFGSCRDLTTAAWAALRPAPAPMAVTAPVAVTLAAPVHPVPPGPTATPPTTAPVLPGPAAWPPNVPPPSAWPPSAWPPSAWPPSAWPPSAWPPNSAPPASRRRARGVAARLGTAVVVLATVGTAFAVPSDSRLTTTATAEQDPLPLPASAALPDSHVVVVLEADDNLDLYVVDVASRAVVRRLTDDGGSDRAPSLSPDRRTIVYLRGTNGASTLRVTATDGQGDRPLFAQPVEGCPDMGRPSWNPVDPEFLVLACTDGAERALRLVTLDGEVMHTLDVGGMYPFDPTFSPDGKTILYSASGIAHSGGGSLYTIAADGSGEPIRLTDGAPGADGGPTWSPTGEQIAFRRRVDNGTRAGNFEIFVINVDGSDPRVLAADPAQDSGPAWSPDGAQIMFMSERMGAGRGSTNHVFVMNSDGTELTLLLRETGGSFGYAPAWGPR